MPQVKIKIQYKFFQIQNIILAYAIKYLNDIKLFKKIKNKYIIIDTK